MASGLGGRVMYRNISRVVAGPWNYIAGKRCDPCQSTGIMKVSRLISVMLHLCLTFIINNASCLYLVLFQFPYTVVATG